MKGPEAIIEDEIVALAKRLGGVALKLVLAGEKGFPDRTILLPGGVVLFVEVKEPNGGKVSEHQKRWIAKLHALGFAATVVCSVDEAANFCTAARIGKRFGLC
jgi:hypothetical protein